MQYPKRKQNRLSEYDYSSPNAYFITICTVDRKNFFWDNPLSIIDCPEDIRLSAYGEIVNRAITNIPAYYPIVSVDNYAIMPNHIHLLLLISSDINGIPIPAPTVSTIIQQLKGVVTKQIGFSVWQKGFHDHVIRGKNDYKEVWEYIENNPIKWSEDCFYAESMQVKK